MDDDPITPFLFLLCREQEKSALFFACFSPGIILPIFKTQRALWFSLFHSFLIAGSPGDGLGRLTPKVSAWLAVVLTCQPAYAGSTQVPFCIQSHYKPHCETFSTFQRWNLITSCLLPSCPLITKPQTGWAERASGSEVGETICTQPQQAQSREENFCLLWPYFGIVSTLANCEAPRITLLLTF